MADHDVVVDLLLDDELETVSTDVRQNATRLTRGVADNLEPIPGTIVGTFDDRARRYNPANPVSDLYGLAGLNTPMRFVVDGDEQWGELAWSPTRTIGGVPKTGFVASGVLDRIGRGESPLSTTLQRMATATPPVAWWPLDDAAGALNARSAIAGVAALQFDGLVRPGVVDATDLMGGGKRPEWVAGDDFTYSGTMLSGAIPTVTTAGYTLDLLVRFGPGLSSNGNLGFTYHAGSTLLYGRLFCAPGGLGDLDPMGVNFSLNRSDGTTQAVFALVQRNVWNHIRVVLRQNGANIDMAMYLDGVLADTDQWVAETLGRLNTVQIGGLTESASNLLDSISMSDWMVWAAEQDIPDIPSAAIGYDGEAAGVRFLRVCDEEGIPAVVVGNPDDTQLMGPQLPATLSETLLETVRTDAALMFATYNDVGLTFRTGRSLYNQDPRLTVSLAAEEVTDPYDLVVSPDLVRNDVTAVAPDGTQARSTLATGAMSVQARPDGVGRYDTRWNVNPYDTGTLEAHAAWHVNRGTYGGIRFASVTIDVTGAPHLADDVAVTDIGDLVLVTGIDPGDSPDDFRGIVLRREQTVRQRRRLVTFVLLPAAPFEVGVVGDTAGTVDLRGQRIDSEVAALSADVSSSATSWSVKTAGGVLMSTDANTWSTTRNGGGLYLLVAGEVVRVTNVSGASSPQTVTVVRSINGVVKSHKANVPVRVRNGPRVGL